METNQATSTPETQLLFEQPFNAIQGELKELSPEELLPIKTDIPAAVTTALGVQPEVLALKDRLAALPEFNAELPTKLGIYAMALSHAQTLYMMASAPANAIKPLADEGSTLRELLFADASALAQRRLMDGNQLKDLRGAVGYKNLAFDLQILAQAFRNSAGTVQGKCATQPAELQRAEEIAAELLRLAGIQEQGPATVDAASDVRTRAFTLFFRAYDQIRRAVTYLRWKEDDVDTIAPSLYANRASPRKKTDIPAPTPPGPTTPAPSGTPPAPGATTPVATTTDPQPATGTKTGPRASPFLNRSDLDS